MPVGYLFCNNPNAAQYLGEKKPAWCGRQKGYMSEKFESSNALGLALLASAGIDIRGALSVTLHCEAGELPTLTVKRAIPAGLSGQVGGILERYSVQHLGAGSVAIPGECVDLSLQTHTNHPQVD